MAFRLKQVILPCLLIINVLSCNSHNSNLYETINQVPIDERFQFLLQEDLVKKYHIVNANFQRTLIAIGYSVRDNYGTMTFYADPVWTKAYLGVSQKDTITADTILLRALINSKLMQKGLKCPETATLQNLLFLAFLDGHSSASAKKTDYYQILQAWCINPEAEKFKKPEAP